jgi:hypothetical protein
MGTELRVRLGGPWALTRGARLRIESNTFGHEDNGQRRPEIGGETLTEFAQGSQLLHAADPGVYKCVQLVDASKVSQRCRPNNSLKNHYSIIKEQFPGTGGKLEFCCRIASSPSVTMDIEQCGKRAAKNPYYEGWTDSLRNPTSVVKAYNCMPLILLLEAGGFAIVTSLPSSPSLLLNKKLQ